MAGLFETSNIIFPDKQFHWQLTHGTYWPVFPIKFHTNGSPAFIIHVPKKIFRCPLGFSHIINWAMIDFKYVYMSWKNVLFVSVGYERSYTTNKFVLYISPLWGWSLISWSWRWGYFPIRPPPFFSILFNNEEGWRKITIPYLSS